MNKIDYEQLYMDTLYHYLAEIYVISEKNLTDKEEEIKKNTDKIKSKYNKDKDDINEINKLIKLIEDNDLIEFKENLKVFIK